MEEFIARFGAALFAAFRRMRRPVTNGICNLLIRFHIKPWHVSLFRIVILIGILPLWAFGYYFLALLALFFNYLLDILDGDLARMLGLDSDLGKFEDITSDNIAVVILMLALIQKGLVAGFLGGYYIFAATLSWWLSVVRKIGSVKSDWLFKPEASAVLHILRFWVVPLFMCIYAFWRIDVFSVLISGISVFLTVIMLCDYFQLIKQGGLQQ